MTEFELGDLACRLINSDTRYSYSTALSSIREAHNIDWEVIEQRGYKKGWDATMKHLKEEMGIIIMGENYD